MPDPVVLDAQIDPPAPAPPSTDPAPPAPAAPAPPAAPAGDEYAQAAAKFRDAAGTPPPAAAQPSEYAQVGEMFRQSREAQLRSSVVAGVQTDADRQAKIVALADQAGLPPAVVARDPDLVSRNLRLSSVDYQRLVKNHPELTGWLNVPGNAAIAQDDLPVLQTLDHALHALAHPEDDPTGVLPSGYRFGKNGTILGPVYGGFADQYENLDALRAELKRRSDGEALDQIDRATRIELATKDFSADGGVTTLASGLLGSSTGSLLVNALRATGKLSQDDEDQLVALHQGAAERTPGIPGRLLGGAIGLATDLPLMFSGAPLAKGAGALLESAGITGRLARSLQTVAALAPINVAQAIEATRQHGAGYGAIDLLINSVIPGAAMGHGAAGALLPEVARAVAPGWAGFAKSLLTEVGAQSAINPALEFAHAVHEWESGVDPAALDRANLVPRLVAAGILGGAQAAAFHLPGGIATKFAQDAQASHAALTYGDQLKTVVDTYGASKTADRSPERMQALVASMLGKTADGKTYLQAEDWDAHWTKAGQDPGRIADEMGVGKAYREAKATGGEMAVPLPTFIDRAAQEGNEGLVAAARSEPGAKSVTEAKAFRTALPDEVAKLAAEVKAQADRVKPADPSADLVRDDVVHQLVEAGHDPAAAKRQADVVAAGFRTLADRWNAGQPEGAAKVDADTLYQRYGLKIQRAAPESVRSGTDRLGAMVDQLKKGSEPKQTDLFGPSLHDFLREQGVSDPGGDLASMEIPTPPFQKKLLREGGRPIDLAAIEAHREGYIPDALPNTLLDAIKQESLGKPVFASDKANPELLSRHQEAQEFRSFVESLGIDPKKASREEILAKLADYQKSHEPAMAAQHQRTLAQSDSGSGVLEVKTAPAGSLNAAAEHFGTTKDLAEAGYILPDGRMLNFSGGARGKRTIDHLDVAEVRGVPGSGFEAMAAFLRAGAMRIDAKEGAVTLETKPTLSQESVIKAIAERRGGELAFDLVDGSRRTGRYYDEGTKPARILGDVRRFYAGEEMGNGKVLFQSAYHGGRIFDRFSNEKIGTGTGHRDYGWGIYFTSKKEIAKDYQRFIGPDGRTYTAEIPEDHSLMSWKDDVAGQPPKVREALEAAVAMMTADRGPFGDESQIELHAPIGLTKTPAGEWPAFNVYHTLASYLGKRERLPMGEGDRLASKWLAEHGVAGVRFPSEAGGATNFVVFDAKDAQVTNYEQGAENAIRRGQIAFGKDRQFSVTLFENANLSTFLHESGHLFLEVLGDLAHEESAPSQIKGDYAKILEWFGAKDRDAISTEHHEQFARGFERYLMEGVAPSGALRQTFARVRAWFVHLYKQLTALRVTLTPEVRGVFDRLLATDEEIAGAEKQAEAEPVFTTAKDAGMSPDEFVSYGKAVQAAHDGAVDDLQQQLMTAYSKELSKQYRDEAKKVRAEKDAEIGKRPVFVAIEALQDGRLPEGVTLPDGETAPKLSKADLLARGYTENDLRSLPGPGKGKANRGRRLYTEDGGIPLDAAADLFGFKGGDDLFRALVNAQDRDELVRQETTAHMREAHPDPATDGSIAERAAEAIHGELRSKVIDQEMHALNKLARDAAPVARQQVDEAVANERAVQEAKAGRASDAADLKQAVADALTGAKVDNLRAQVQEGKDAAKADLGARRQVMRSLPPLDLVRVAAAETIRAKRVRDLRPDLYQGAARKASRAAIAAMAKGDYTAAVDAKKQELLNTELYRAAAKAVDASEKTQRYLSRFDEGATRERIGKAGGWEWTVAAPDGSETKHPSEDAAREAASAIPGAQFGRTSSYLDQIDRLLERFEFRPASNKALDRRQSLRDFVATHNEFGQLDAIPDDILNEAFRINYRELTVEQLQGLHDAVKSVESAARLKNKLLAAQKERDLAEVVGAAVASVEGNSKGPRPLKVGRGFGDSIPNGIGTFLAAHRKMASLIHEMDGFKDQGPLWESLMRPLNEAQDRETEMRMAGNEKLVELMKEWGKDGPSAKIRRDVPGIAEKLSLEARVAVAFNWGNAGNRARLMKGYQWSEEQVQRVLDSLDEKDKAFVEGATAHINSYWSEIRAKQERVTGVAPEKVEALPFQTAAGEWKGGYFPAKYDGELSARSFADAAAEQAKMLMAGSYSKATTRRGHTEARQGEGSGQPLRLDFGVIREHIAQVTHDLSHHETLIDLSRIIGNDDFQKAVISHYGKPVLEQFQATLKDVAAGQVGAANGVEKLLNWVRSGTTVGTIGFNLTNAISNLSGVVNGFARVKPLYLVRAFARLNANPFAWAEANRWAGEQSVFMLNRSKTATPEYNDFRQGVRSTVGQKVGGAAVDASYFVADMAYKAMEVPTFIGRYEQAMDETGGDHAAAVQLANQAVIDAHGSGFAKDLANVQRGSPAWKLFTTLYGWFNATYNLLAESGKMVRVDPVKAFAHFLTVGVISPMLYKLVKDGLTGNDEDYKDPAKFIGAMAREEAGFLLSTVALGRELSNAITGVMGYSGPAGTRGIDQLHTILQDATHDRLGHGAAKAAAGVIGTLFHLPTQAVARAVDGYLYAQTHHTSPLQPILFGKPPHPK